MTPAELKKFVRESNRIEGIIREPKSAEIDATADLIGRSEICVIDLVSFVSICAPGANLRLAPGMDVRVGDHYPPSGGPEIGYSIGSLIRRANLPNSEPHSIHLEYETLHPFMDGNGRSGRVLWAWMMHQRGDRLLRLGFLHAWYYQSLSHRAPIS